MLRSLLLTALVGAAPLVGAQDWQLVWSDEFDYEGALDSTKWTFETGGHGWGNQELQHYTDRLDNARADGEHLVIEAIKEDYNGNAYTSARVNSAASWTYGRFEIRAKLPSGRGTWPALWMLASQSTYGTQYWPDNGEIDIMEHVGYDPNVVHATVHTKAFNHNIGTQVGESIQVPTAMTDFNVYAVEWRPNEIRAYVNGEHYFTFANSESYTWREWPFDRDFHLLLNIAVGGAWGGAQGVDDTIFPQEMVIDYVRVYQEANPYPEVSLVSPSGGTTVEAGGTVELVATASDSDDIEEVRFFQDDGVLGADIFAPYGLNVEGVVDGCYVLRARATDAAGYATLSEPVEVTVGAGCPEGSTAPYLMRPAAVPGPVQAEHYDLGGADVAYRDLGETNTGGGIRQGGGVDIRPSLDLGGGYDVTDITAREWLTYTVEVAETGSYRVQARVAGSEGGTLRLSVDGEDLFGDVALPTTTGDGAYVNAFLGNVDLTAGRHTVRLDMRSAGFSLNLLRFTHLGPTAGEGDGGDLGLDLRLAPNPAADASEITYRLPEAGHVEVGVYDAVGRRVAVVVSGAAPAGEHTATLDVGALAPGLYTCVLQTSGGVRSERLAVVR